MRGLLFALFFLGGLVPLALVDLLLVSAASRDGRGLETAAILAAPALLLAILAWVFSGWAADVVVEPMRRLSEACGRLARGRFDTWVTPGGAVNELASLSNEFNRMAALTHETVLRLRRGERESATLATDAMRLFQQAVQAKEPLTKHHPGLLEAYSQAVTRQLAEHADEFESAELAMSPFKRRPDAEAEDKAERRTQPRYEIDDVVLNAPVGARILDVSAVGLGLESMERLTLGREDSFEVADRARRLRIPASAVWCKLVRTVKTASGDRVPVYRAGVRFAETFSAADRDELLEIVQTHRHVA